MYVGRVGEVAELTSAIDAARSGQGGVRVIVGTAGLGKTRLLDEVVGRSPGVIVLRACGVESEVGLAFAVLRDLLAPVADGVDALVGGQRLAMRAALGIGELDATAVVGDLALYIGAVEMLKEAAARRPVVVVVDDAQWIDPASGSVLGFVARRLSGHRITMLVASRDASLSWIDPQIPRTALGALDGTSSESLVRHVAPGLSQAVVERVILDGQGNPLALIEIAHDLRASVEPSHPTLVGPRRLSALYADRIAKLSDGARFALVVTALGSGNAPAAALQRAGRFDDLDDAVRADLITIARNVVTFSHPMARTAAMASASTSQTRAAHSLLVEVSGPDERPWHRAGAVDGPDPTIADELGALGDRLVRRGAFVEAAKAFAAAALRCVSTDAVAVKLDRAAEFAFRGGDRGWAVELAEEAVGLAESRPQTKHRALFRQGAVQIGAGSFERGGAVLGRLLADPTVDPVLALEATIELSRLALGAGRLDILRPSTARARELLRIASDPSARVRLCGALTMDALASRDFAEVGELLRDFDAALPEVFPGRDIVRAMGLVFLIRSQRDDFHRVAEVLPGFIAIAENAGEFGGTPYLWTVLADARFRTGDWDGALAACNVVRESAAVLGFDGPVAASIGTAAWIAVARGDTAIAASMEETLAQVASSAGRSFLQNYISGAEGMRLLLDGDPSGAHRAFAGLRSYLADGGELDPSQTVLWPLVVEASLAAGDRGAANDVRAVVAQLVDGTDNPLSLSIVACIDAMVGRGDPEERFAAALDQETKAPFPFLRGVVMSAYGSWIRHDGRQTEARTVLADAAAVFASLGATAFLARTEHERRLAGGRRRTTSTPTTELSERERDVIRAVAEGRTNREIAAQLFVSEKTIEAQLSHLYLRLGARNRTELARFVREEQIPR